FQKKFEAAIKSQEPRSLFRTLKELQITPSLFSASLLEEARQHDDSLQFPVDLLSKDLASQISFERDWLGEFGLRETLLQWNATLIKMTEDAKLIEIQLPGYSLANPVIKLSLQGYFPRLSQLTQKL